MFFDIFDDLCKKKGISCKKAAQDVGLSNSITTKWKKTGATPSGETLDKIANYFGVSTDYLLEIINLSDDQQEKIFNIFSSALNSKGVTAAEAIQFSGVKNNFFPRLQIKHLHKVSKLHLMGVANYLDVSEKIVSIIESEEKNNPSEISFTEMDMDILLAFHSKSPAEQHALLTLLGLPGDYLKDV